MKLLCCTPFTSSVKRVREVRETEKRVRMGSMARNKQIYIPPHFHRTCLLEEPDCWNGENDKVWMVRE